MSNLAYGDRRRRALRAIAQSAHHDVTDKPLRVYALIRLTLLYRLNLAARTTESFIDFFDRQQFTVAPVVSWQIGDRTIFSNPDSIHFHNKQLALLMFCITMTR
ncbi:hypothetical protein [Scytonema sp. PRP1]|uniref:hypothetical protein n=1 Tax=Scytonema sp. PRP1 TaxID=3120513 RepID=UPI002FCF988C